MNEVDLYRYALISCILGFLVLGFVVLFVPVSFSDDSSTYIDGLVLNSYSTDSGAVVVIRSLEEMSLFFDEDVSFDIGSSYRFYNPSGSDLILVSNFRILQ